MICVCSIISVISASYYSEVNLHGFVKLFNFAVRRNVHYIWHRMVITVVLLNLYKSMKIIDFVNDNLES
jgi:hypothetical protein